jgi:hypothetical protein
MILFSIYFIRLKEEKILFRLSFVIVYFFLIKKTEVFLFQASKDTTF